MQPSAHLGSKPSERQECLKMIKAELARYNFHLLCCYYFPQSTDYEYVSSRHPQCASKRYFIIALYEFKHFQDNTIRQTYVYMQSPDLYMTLPAWFVISGVFAQTSDLLVLEIYNSLSKILQTGAQHVGERSVLITQCVLTLSFHGN